MIRAAENNSANCRGVPNIAPMRSAYFAAYCGCWSAGGTSSACSATPSMRTMSLPMSVTSRPSVTLGFALMLRSFIFFGWVYTRIVSFLTHQEPHRHAVGLAIWADRRQPRDQIAVQPALDVL